MTSRIYWIRQSVDDEDLRPDGVTYHDPQGNFKTPEGFKKFQENCSVAAGKHGHPRENWFVPDLHASKPGKSRIDEWDYYMCATFGVFSQRAISVLAPFLGDRFTPLPARLEGLSYSCLHCRSRIDCLDKSKSQIIYYDTTQQEVMTIEKHVFRKTQLVDPVIFAIPDAMFRLYCTDSIPEIATSAGLTGFTFELVDG